MNTEPVRWAVLGQGWGGTPHNRAALASDGVELVGVCDADPTRLRDVATPAEVAHYGSIDELLAHAAPEVVTVATPPGDHLPSAQRLLAEGVHVVLEKPPVLSLKDLDVLLEHEAASTARVFPVVQYRYHPALWDLREKLRAGSLGRIVSIEITVVWPRDDRYYRENAWRRRRGDGGGPLMNQAYHHLDLVQWTVAPWRDWRITGATVFAEVDRDDDILVVSGPLDHPDNPIGTVHVATAGPLGQNHESMLVVTEGKLFHAQGFRFERAWTGPVEEPAAAHEGLDAYLYGEVTRQVAAAVRGEESDAPRLAEMRPALRVALDEQFPA